VDKCPFCKRGQKVPCTYTLAGSSVEKDCSYCGFCGRNWPAPLRDVKAAERDVKMAQAGERDDE
jgi:hypothetical protein